MGILSSLIGGIGSGISSLIEGAQTRKNIQAQAIANKNLSEYTFNRDVAQWKAQNEYNSPKAQMDRFKAAGLNPNLIYDKGTPGLATSNVSYSKPEAPNYMARKPLINPLNMLNDYLDINSKQALLSNQLAQNALISENVRGKKIENTIAEKYASDLALAKLDLLKSQDFSTHEQGLMNQWKNYISSSTIKNMINALNENYQLSTQTKRTMLGIYNTDYALKQQQQQINQWKIDFMKNPKLNWSNLVQAFQILK